MGINIRNIPSIVNDYCDEHIAELSTELDGWLIGYWNRIATDVETHLGIDSEHHLDNEIVEASYNAVKTKLLDYWKNNY